MKTPFTSAPGFTEMGQGLFTVCIQFAVEATGLPPESLHRLDRHIATAGLRPNHGQSSDGVGGQRDRRRRAGHCDVALDEGQTLRDLVGQVFTGEWICDYTTKLGEDLDKPGGPKTHLTYGFATQVAILDDDGRLQKMIAAHDVGRVINPSAAGRTDVRLTAHGHRLRADRGF